MLLTKAAIWKKNKTVSLPHTITLAPSAGSSLACQGTLVLSRDILIVTNCRARGRGGDVYYWQLVGRGQECCLIFHSAQDGSSPNCQ